MVYSAYHSKACAECRLRRTKCDILRPACSQCIRAGRECKGYRDYADFMFRDESQRQVIKHQLRTDSKQTSTTKTKKVAKKPKSGGKSSRSKAQNFPTNSRATLLVTNGLGISPQEQAQCYFFRNCVLEEDQHGRGCFQYLSGLFTHQKVNPGLSDSVTALGMAGMSHMWKSPKLMASAQMKYNSALRHIGCLLRDVEKAKEDQTLIAVMLLGLYETNTCHSRESMDSWTKHITGATSLLHYRGKKQLKTPLGRQLFTHLRTQVIINCMQRHVAVPSSICQWSQALETEAPEEAAVTQLCQLGIKYCKLRSSIQSFRDFSNQAYVISTACALDSEYTAWALRCPVPSNINTIMIKEPSEAVFADCYHKYLSLWDATVWNNYRAVRLLLNELILVQICHIYPFCDDTSLNAEENSFLEIQLLASNATVLQLSLEICASVPFFLGYELENKSAFSTPKTINGNLILWPLYIAASTSMVSNAMRNWVAARLYWISATMGIRQAIPLAYNLSINQELSDWQDGGFDPCNFDTACLQECL